MYGEKVKGSARLRIKALDKSTDEGEVIGETKSNLVSRELLIVIGLTNLYTHVLSFFIFLIV